ncbi:hypothetical protein BH10BDE1_BH10BDE1_16530 [soil metagenome]
MPLFTTPNAKINALDLSMLLTKSTDADSGYGWSREDAAEISELYRAFLFLCASYPNEIIVPPREVDDLWHLHILDTRKYIADCDFIFGAYLHHYPYAGLSLSNVESSQEAEHKERTLALMQKHFPELIGEHAT